MLKSRWILVLLTLFSLTACQEESMEKKDTKEKKAADNEDETDTSSASQSDDPIDKEHEYAFDAAYACEEAMAMDITDCDANGIVGDWQSTDICFSTDIGDIFADALGCPNARIDLDMDYDAILSIREDNRWTTQVNDISGTETIAFDDSCLEDTLGISPSEGCDLFQDTYESCTYSAGWCICDTAADMSGEDTYPATSSGSYSIDGDVMITVDDETGEASEGRFCVQGNTVYFYYTDTELNADYVMIMTRL